MEGDAASDGGRNPAEESPRLRRGERARGVPRPPEGDRQSDSPEEADVFAPRTAVAAVVPAALGALVAAVSASYVLPVLALAVGAAALFPLAWRSRADYAVATTLFVLAVGAYVAGVDLGVAYGGWTGPILFVLGGASGLFLLVKHGVKALVRAAGRRYARGRVWAELWDVGASLVSLGYVLWNAIQVAERVVRSLALAVVGPSMVALNVYMTLADAVSAVLVDLTAGAFVLALLLGAHTLGTWDRAAALVRGWTPARRPR